MAKSATKPQKKSIVKKVTNFIKNTKNQLQISAEKKKFGAPLGSEASVPTKFTNKIIAAQKSTKKAKK